MPEIFRVPPKWLKATIIERTGPVSYRVQIGKEICKRHVDQIQKFHDRFTSSNSVTPLPDNATIPEPIQQHHAMPESEQANGTVIDSQQQYDPPINVDAPDLNDPTTVQPTATVPLQPRYPSRARQPPTRLGYDE